MKNFTTKWCYGIDAVRDGRQRPLVMGCEPNLAKLFQTVYGMASYYALVCGDSDIRVTLERVCQACGGSGKLPHRQHKHKTAKCGFCGGYLGPVESIHDLRLELSEATTRCPRDWPIFQEEVSQ